MSHFSGQEAGNLTRVDYDDFFMYVSKKNAYKFLKNDQEKFFSDLLINLVSEAAGIADIGAGCGYYTLLAASKTGKGKIYAIEPDREKYEVLLKNVGDNGFLQVECLNISVSGEPREESSAAAGMPGRVAGPRRRDQEAEAGETIPAKTLDDLFSGRKIDLFRISARGNASEILRGARNTLKANPQAKIMIHLDPDFPESNAGKPDMLPEELLALGFDVIFINENPRNFCKLRDVADWETLLNGQTGRNILCLKKDEYPLVTFFSHSALRGGAELSLLELIKGLITRKILCHVVLPSDGYLTREFRKLPVAVDVAPLPWWICDKPENRSEVNKAVLASVVEAIRILAKVSPDLVYTNTSVLPQGAIASKELDIQHFWRINEHGEKDHGFEFLLDFGQRAAFIYEHSEKIIFNSKNLKSSFDEFIPDDKSTVIYNHVILQAAGDRVESPFKRQQSLKLILAGSVNTGKGQLEAVQAVSYAAEKYGDDLELAVFGRIQSPGYYGEIQKFIEDNSLADRISFNGFVNNPAGKFAAADLVLMCSRSEAFGRVTVEAMLMGKPVIGANAGATPEILRDGVSGLLYEAGNHEDLGEKIHSLYVARDKIRTLGLNALTFANENFSEEKYSGRIADLFREYLRKKDGVKKHDPGFVLALGENFFEFGKVIPGQAKEIERQRSIISEKEKIIKAREDTISALVSSFSWKFTRPLRWLHSLFFRVFYLFFPYQTRRWSFIKGLMQLVLILPLQTIRGLISGGKIHGLKSGNALKAGSISGTPETVRQRCSHAGLTGSGQKADTGRSHGGPGTYRGAVSILFVGHDARVAGAQVLLLSLVRWLKEHTGIEMRILLLHEGALLEQFRTIAPTVVWEDLLRSYPNEEESKVRLRHFTGKPGLIYGNTSLAPAVYDVLEFLHAPFVTHVHELEITIRICTDDKTLRKMLLFTDGFIACSPPVALNLIHRHHAGVEKIRTILSFADKREIKNPVSKAALRKKLGLAENDFLIFGCGTMDWRKGTDLFIETALKMRQKGITDFHFCWIGKNIWDTLPIPDRKISWKDLEEAVAGENLAKQISFTGFRDNVFEYFQAGDVFYLPSREDAFPLVCLEAAQCGLPVVCFEGAGGMPDFIENDAGYVVPCEDTEAAADKLFFLYHNPMVTKTLGAAARSKFLHLHSTGTAAPEILSWCRRIGNFGPAVSIIVPNYNCGKFLEKRLDSIFNQTFRDFEVIILDDASTDGSLEIIEKYLHLPDVRFIQNKTNGGSPFVQWHKGYLEARGEILWFAEADDFCEPGFLHKLLPDFNDRNVALAFCDSIKIDENGTILGDYGQYHEKLDPRHWKSSYRVTASQEINYGLGVKNSIPNASAVLIRRSCVSAEFFDEACHFRFLGDWYFYTKVIKGRHLAFHPEKLNYHRKHGQTITRRFNTERTDLLIKETGEMHESILDNYLVSAAFKDKWEFYLQEQICGYYPETRKEGFEKYYPYGMVEEKIRQAVVRGGRSKRLVFITTNNSSPTGGSEKLWRLAATECSKQGHEVMAVVKRWSPEPAVISDLYNQEITVIYEEPGHFERILEFGPDLLVFSLGDQDEGTEYYSRCRKLGLPYVLVNQLTKEPEVYPVRQDITEQVREGYLGAETVLFTGENNREVMERRLNCKIPRYGIFFNPYDVGRNTDLPFPSMDDGLKLAMPAKLLHIHKGQRLAIELLNMRKWRDRPVHLNLYGRGNDEEVLRKLVTDYHMKNVTFHGHTENILSVWEINHAIFMTSFMEGLPLALVGAMICGRVPIVTDVGAHREVVDDNICGFIAVRPTVEAVDDALERAFQRSGEWPEIGRKARQRILSCTPEDPVDHFISQILPFAGGKKRN